MKTVLVLVAFLAPLYAQDSGTIAGTVVDSFTGTPIADVSVYFGAAKGGEYKTSTDANGRFRVTGLKPDDYGSHYEKSDYIPQYSGTNNSPLHVVKIARGGDPVQVQVRLTAYATLRARVLDPDGRPGAKASVTLGIDTEMTNADGEVEFTEIRPGNYTLDATLLPPQKEPQPNGERTEPIRTWYPSAPEREQAETIRIQGGNHLTGYEIRVKSSPVYRVRGVVLGTDGKPVPHAVVQFVSPNDQPLASMLTSLTTKKQPDGTVRFTDFGSLAFFTVFRQPARVQIEEEPNTQDGAFDFPSVPRGQRVFKAVASPLLPGRTPAADSLPVMVDHDIDDLVLRFAAPFTLDGSVEIPGQVPDPLMISLNGAVASSRVRPDGSIHITDIAPGDYNITAAPGLPGGYYLASILLGPQEILGKTVALNAGTPPLKVIYKPNGGTVSGTVERDASAVVMLRMNDDGNGVDNIARTATVVSDNFAIESLRPGSYYMFAVDRLNPSTYYTPAFLNDLPRIATTVKVDEGSSVSLKLKTTHAE